MLKDSLQEKLARLRNGQYLSLVLSLFIPLIFYFSPQPPLFVFLTLATAAGTILAINIASHNNHINLLSKSQDNINKTKKQMLITHSAITKKMSEGNMGSKESAIIDEILSILNRVLETHDEITLFRNERLYFSTLTIAIISLFSSILAIVMGGEPSSFFVYLASYLLALAFCWTVLLFIYYNMATIWILELIQLYDYVEMVSLSYHDPMLYEKLKAVFENNKMKIILSHLMSK